MNESVFTLFRYCISGEDSRPGLQDYWRHGILAGKPRGTRLFWEFSKTFVVLGAAMSLGAVLTRLL